MMAGLSRRDVLRAGGGAVLGGTVLSACSFFSTEPQRTGGQAASRDATEAPMLTERVKAGKLPKLEERLPKDPLVVKPLDRPGRYGGMLQRGQVDRNFIGSDYMAFASLVEWSPTTPPEPTPALAKSWEIEDDGRVFVFHLREGLKWSDGEPFTTDDLMYTYEHVYSNEELASVYPTTWLRTGGKLGRFVQVDKQTIRFEFSEPHGLLLKHLCFIQTAGSLLQPKHYLSKFHKEFLDEAELDKLMKKFQVKTWQDLYEGRNNKWDNADLPIMGAWKVVDPVGAGNTAKVERNAYYWKVDEDDRQLPYIDGAVFTILSSETLALRGASGRIDMDLSGMPTDSYSLLLRKQKSEPYRVLRWVPDGMFACFHLNQSHPDPVLRKLFGDIEFRAGLSKAINRKEMNDGLLAGQGIIQHPCGQEGDRYFEKGMGKRFTEYDVDAANEHLDNAGLTKRDKDGMRLRPDGKKMRLVAQTFIEGGISSVEVMEYVKRYAAEVGIDIRIKQISLTLWYERMPQGEYDIAGYSSAGYLWEIDPLWYVPVAGTTYWAPKYGNWYANPDDKWAMKPAGDIRRLQVLFDELKQTVDEKAQLELGKEILRLHDKNVWIIGSVQAQLNPFVVSDDLANLREKGIASFRTHYEAATDLSQVYFKHPERHT